MLKAGKKFFEWQVAKARLIKEYQQKRITRCERCGGNFMLSFHHFNKRSSCKAEHTFEGTRLLCAVCHNICEYNKEENAQLLSVRKKRHLKKSK